MVKKKAAPKKKDAPTSTTTRPETEAALVAAVKQAEAEAPEPSVVEAALSKVAQRGPARALPPGIKLDTGQMALLRRTMLADGTEDDAKSFFYQVNRTQLDPFNRQIYATFRPMRDGDSWTKKLSVQVSIDGFRLIAERSRQYAGQVGPYYCGKDGKWVDIWLSKEPPFAAKVGVRRRDFDDTLWATARFESYAQTKQGGELNFIWKKMGDLMIAKCAESLALRKAFPFELSGLYTTDEMAQASNVAAVTTRRGITFDDESGVTYDKATGEVIPNDQLDPTPEDLYTDPNDGGTLRGGDQPPASAPEPEDKPKAARKTAGTKPYTGTKDFGTRKVSEKQVKFLQFEANKAAKKGRDKADTWEYIKTTYNVTTLEDLLMNDIDKILKWLQEEPAGEDPDAGAQPKLVPDDELFT
jgi:phage recombination protein Bet